MAGNALESGRSVTSKIASVLLTFTEGSEHSVTEIARLTRLPVSTAHRLTSELAVRRLLDRSENGLYRPALPLRTLGAADAGPPRLTERAPYVLEDLAEVTRSRARLGVLVDSRVSYIEKVPGNGPVSSFSGRATLPAHPTALGRVLLAFSPPSTAEMIINGGLRAYTPHTVISRDDFRRALAVTKLTKVAMVRAEMEPGIGGVAMPVFGPRGEVIAAIELAVTDFGSDLHPVMATLAIASRSLSRELAAGRQSDPPAEAVAVGT